MTGEENGIIWQVIEWVSPTYITIYDTSGKVLHREEYQWIHEPVFGPDIDDCIEINKILDGLIKKYGR